MKTPKLVTAIIAIFLFSNLLIASIPDNRTSKTQENPMLKKLYENVNLSNEQKRIIQLSGDEYLSKMNKCIKDSTIINKNEIMNTALLKYKAVLDSVLTTQQKDTLKTRTNRSIIKEISNSKK